MFVSLCIRSLGRAQNATYMKFLRTLNTNSTEKTVAEKELLRCFDFDFKSWPVDFSVKELSEYVNDSNQDFVNLVYSYCVIVTETSASQRTIKARPSRSRSGFRRCRVKSPRTLLFTPSAFV